MYLCLCKGLTETDVRAVAQAGLTSPEELIDALALDDEFCCGRCALEIDSFVAVAKEEWARVHPAPAS